MHLFQMFSLAETLLNEQSSIYKNSNFIKL